VLFAIDVFGHQNYASGYVRNRGLNRGLKRGLNRDLIGEDDPIAPIDPNAPSAPIGQEDEPSFNLISGLDDEWAQLLDPFVLEIITRSTINLIYPVGSIYIQFANASDPNTLYPNLKFIDITSNYTGLFFRAEGNGSLPFGQVQEENEPRLTSVNRGTNTYNGLITLPVGAWSAFIESGQAGALGSTLSHQFFTSGGEIRPRNTAVRIWQRIC